MTNQKQAVLISIASLILVSVGMLSSMYSDFKPSSNTNSDGQSIETQMIIDKFCSDLNKKGTFGCE
jgi:hypothetical protein